MNAVPNFRRRLVSTSAIAKIVGIIGVASLGACAVMSDEPPIEVTRSNTPLSVAEVPEVDWDGAKTVHLLLADYVISPDKPSFTAGTAYRLVIRNTGDDTHVVDAEYFFNAVAIKSVQMSAFAGHTGEDHVDEALGPKGLDGVPSVPDIDDGEVMASESAEAAESGDKADTDADDAANPFAAKPEEAEETEASVEQTAETPEEDKPAPADEPKSEMAVDEDKPAPASESESAAQADDADENTEVAEKDGDNDDAPESASSAPDWELVRVANVSIEPGHVTTIEFIAVRPGHYRLTSGDWLATVRGMSTIASIVAPEAETKTAAVSE